ADLTLMEEQLARTARGMLEAIGLQVFGDVRIVQPQLAPLRTGERVGNVGPPFAKRLHLSPGERNPRLIGLADFVAEACAAVDRGGPDGRLRLAGHCLS